MIFWIIFGGLAGWIASKIMGKDASMGLLANIVVGCVGSFIGGIIGTKVLNIGKVTGFNLTSFFIAILGSVILLWIINRFGGKK